MFEYINFEDVDENYNPYDAIANGRIRKCKYGAYYGVANYCCHKCFQEQKNKRYLHKINFVEEFFKEFYTDNNNYIFKNNDIPLIDDDWKTLNLIPPKTLDEIKKQYRKLALKLHPDKPSGNHTKFIELNTAYNNLITIQT